MEKGSRLGPGRLGDATGRPFGREAVWVREYLSAKTIGGKVDSNKCRLDKNKETRVNAGTIFYIRTYETDIDWLG